MKNALVGFRTNKYLERRFVLFVILNVRNRLGLLNKSSNSILYNWLSWLELVFDYVRLMSLRFVCDFECAQPSRTTK